jgi:hypothetical protein
MDRFRFCSRRAGIWTTMLKRVVPGQRGDFGALGLFVARALQLASGFAISVILVWHFGLPAAGTYALASLPGAVANFFCALGLGSALPKLLVSNPQRATIGLLTTFATYPIIAACCFAYGLLEGRNPGDGVLIALLAFGAGVLGQITVQQCLYVLQRRAAWAPVASLVQFLGIAAAATCPNFESFAIVLTASRVLSCVAGFVPLSYGSVSLSMLRRGIVGGLRFVPLDLALMFSEVLPIAFMPIFLTRAEIGMLGLARQFVTVADTPGWSYVQANYPALVADIHGNGPGVARWNNVLALGTIAGVGLVAITMALAVYNVPSLIPVLIAMLVVMPARYAGYFYDQTLRATGKVLDCTKLALVKIALSASLYLLLCTLLGFWGSVMAFVFLSLGSTLIYRSRLAFHFPSLLPALRPWRFS